MNIFMLDNNPFKAARMHCDKHVVKMILESAQMLSTAHRVLDDNDYADANKLYKATHKNHPSNVWVRESHHNYQWLHSLFVSLLLEYEKRYNKTHACDRLVNHLLACPNNIDITNYEITPLPQCMPDQYKVEGDAVQAYRNYYQAEKSYFAKWQRGTSEPTWWKEQTNE
jgi:hypothetical protein|tara:strand:+ start:437 stop:943 length:507 start_codon:yes stop_codon:yes gene_type:complete